MTKCMLKKRNKIVFITICSICAVFFLIFSTGRRVINGRNYDKERQRNFIRHITLEGVVSNVTNEYAIVKIDDISNNFLILPIEYIPAYHFEVSSKKTCLFLNRKRLKLYNIKKGNEVKKNKETDSIIIGRDNYSLFD